MFIHVVFLIFALFVILVISADTNGGSIKKTQNVQPELPNSLDDLSDAQQSKNQSDINNHPSKIIRFSYSDKNTDIGPLVWDDINHVKSAKWNTNKCATESSAWVTPINIITNAVIAPKGEYQGTGFWNLDPETKKTYKSLAFTISNFGRGVDTMNWEFGHPTDAYHGIEIRPPMPGTFQLSDRLDVISTTGKGAWLGLDENTFYDFSFAAIFYCDFYSANRQRSMHRIDGKRFPLEIDLIFLSRPRGIGTDNYICYDQRDPHCGTVAVMVAILGELGPDDNERLEPIIEAAAKYQGPDFGTNETASNYLKFIKKPFSASWIIPDISSYFYYEDGSFPVPPCWYIARVYVIKNPIKISLRQLNILTNIRTAREPTTKNKLPCTYSVLREPHDNQDIKYNLNPYVIDGDDKRPMSEDDLKQKRERESGRGMFTANSAKLTMPAFLISILNVLCVSCYSSK